MTLASIHVVSVLLLACTVCGGLALYALYGFLRCVRSPRRLLRVVVAEEGTAVVEFPFALLVLIVMTMLTWQLGYMIVAYNVVDVAAFGAARSAIVEGPEGRDAYAEAEAAAAVALIPVADSGSGYGGTGGGIAGQVRRARGGDIVESVMSESDLDRRYRYALRNTDVRVDGAGAAGGRPVRATIRHQFSLKIPIAARVFGRRAGAGYVTEITAGATLLSERYAEVQPSDGPPGSGVGP